MVRNGFEEKSGFRIKIVHLTLVKQPITIPNKCKCITIALSLRWNGQLLSSQALHMSKLRDSTKTPLFS